MNQNTFITTVLLGLLAAFLMGKAPILFGSIFAAGFIAGLIIPASSTWKELATRVMAITITLGVTFALSSLILFRDSEARLFGMFIIALIMGTAMGGFSILVASLLKNLATLIRQKQLIKA